MEVGCGYGCSEVLVVADAPIPGLGEGDGGKVGAVVELARRQPPTNIISTNINPEMNIEVYLLCITQPNQYSSPRYLPPARLIWESLVNYTIDLYPALWDR